MKAILVFAMLIPLLLLVLIAVLYLSSLTALTEETRRNIYSDLVEQAPKAVRA